MPVTRSREAYLVDGVRSPRGKGKTSGALHALHPQELLARVLNALADRTHLDTSSVDDVIMGNGSFDAEHGSDIARLAVLTAGWPVAVPGVTIARFCGSGQQAVTFAAMGISAGHQDLVIAGGVESMSRWQPVTAGFTLDGQNPVLRQRYPMVPQGISADLIATIEGISRTDADEFAARSQRQCAVAQAENRFARSIVAIDAPDGTRLLDKDELPRPDTTVERLASLPPAFAELGVRTDLGYELSYDELCCTAYPEISTLNHIHHAGNSSGVVDGAAAILLASSDAMGQHGWTPRARVIATAVVGSDPIQMLTAPGPAAERCLRNAGMSIADIDLWEINEAFAAVVIKTVDDLKIDLDRVNVNGGAIALGHPIGASGPILIETALDELERTGGATALITMCTGGGMGTATIIERV